MSTFGAPGFKSPRSSPTTFSRLGYSVRVVTVALLVEVVVTVVAAAVEGVLGGVLRGVLGGVPGGVIGAVVQRYTEAEVFFGSALVTGGRMSPTRPPTS